MSKVEALKVYTQSVQELEVYQRAFELSLHVHKQTLEFPKMEQYALADQMRRASKGICANIAEGYAKQSFSPAEFKRFLAMAIASAAEMRVWVSYGQRLGYVDVDLASQWNSEYVIIEKQAGKLRSVVGQ